MPVDLRTCRIDGDASCPLAISMLSRANPSDHFNHDDGE